MCISDCYFDFEKISIKNVAVKERLLSSKDSDVNIINSTILIGYMKPSDKMSVKS